MLYILGLCQFFKLNLECLQFLLHSIIISLSTLEHFLVWCFDSRWAETGFNEDCLVVWNSRYNFHLVNKCLVACKEEVQYAGGGFSDSSWFWYHLIQIEVFRCVHQLMYHGAIWGILTDTFILPVDIPQIEVTKVCTLICSSWSVCKSSDDYDVTVHLCYFLWACTARLCDKCQHFWILLITESFACTMRTVCVSYNTIFYGNQN